MAKTAKELKESRETGIGLGLAFIILGIIIQFVFFGNDIAIWGATIAIAVGIGFLGLSLEANEDPKNGWSDIGVGALFFLPGFLGVFYFSSTVIKLLCLLPLLVGIFGIVLGIVKQSNISQKLDNPSTKETNTADTNSSQRSILGIIITLTGFLSNIATIISIFIR